MKKSCSITKMTARCRPDSSHWSDVDSKSSQYLSLCNYRLATTYAYTQYSTYSKLMSKV